MSRLISWGMTPVIFFRARLLIPEARPPTVSVPAVMGETQWIMRTVVVLPAPFGPRKPKHSPSWISKSMPATATKSPYFFVSPEALTRTAMTAASHPLEEGLEPGVAAQGIEVAVMLVPALLEQAPGRGALQAVDGVLDVAGQGVDAAEIVEEHGIVGIDAAGLPGPLEPFLFEAEGDQT